jgi:hypothetical protein
VALSVVPLKRLFFNAPASTGSLAGGVPSACFISSGPLTTPPPAEKITARHDQARQTCAYYGTRNFNAPTTQSFMS